MIKRYLEDDDDEEEKEEMKEKEEKSSNKDFLMRFIYMIFILFHII